MAFVFPTNPTVGQKYTEFGKTWEWDGEAWRGSTLTLINAAQLGGLTASQFLRSDADDIMNASNLSIVSASSFAQLRLTATNSTTPRLWAVNVNNGDGSFRINEDATTSQSRLVIVEGGNVGIGTTTPGAKLEISSSSGGNTGYSAIRVTNTSFGGGLFAFGNSSTSNLGSFGVITEDVGNGVFNDGVFTVSLAADAVSTERFRITSRGNVGIGTSSPTARLTTADGLMSFVSADANGYARFTATNGSAQLGLFRSGTSAGGGYIGANGEASLIVYDGSFAERMRITSAGRVGIGTTAPGAKLHVAGNLGAVIGAGGSAIRLTNTDTGNFASISAGIVGVSNVGMDFSVDGTRRMTIDSSGHVSPGTNNTQDLGTTSLRWRNIYTNDLNLSNGIGDYTIVEGEEDLFLYNNKNGKTYKFLIQEVDPLTAPPKSEK
jgi:hypothetical protein